MYNSDDEKQLVDKNKCDTMFESIKHFEIIANQND